MFCAPCAADAVASSSASAAPLTALRGLAPRKNTRCCPACLQNPPPASVAAAKHWLTCRTVESRTFGGHGTSATRHTVKARSCGHFSQAPTIHLLCYSLSAYAFGVCTTALSRFVDGCVFRGVGRLGRCATVKAANMAVERDGQKLRFWFPTLRSGRPSLLRYSLSSVHEHIHNSFAPITFAGTISKRDFSRVQSMLLPSWVRWYVLIPCVLYVFVSAGVGWSKAISDPASSLPDLILSGVVLLACAAIAKYGRIRAWRNTVSLVGKVHGAATERGIEWVTMNTTSTFEWEKFVKARWQEANLSLVFSILRVVLSFPTRVLRF